MATNDKKDPRIDWVDKLRTFFGFGNHPQRQTVMPPGKPRFSIWYFVFAMIFLSLVDRPDINGREAIPKMSS